MTYCKVLEISPEQLIPLVEQRRELWDKNSDEFRDKAMRANAWKEICYALNPEMDRLDEEEKKDLIKSVSTKWIHIRDAFLRSQKTGKKNARSGSRKSKPYIYKNLLKFLAKVYEPLTSHDSYNESISSDSSSEGASPDKPYHPPKKRLRVEKNPLDDSMTRFFDSKPSEPDEHPQVSFMKGILPSIATFDDDENLEFQAGVLALVQKIRRRRQEHGEYSYDVKVFGT